MKLAFTLLVASLASGSAKNQVSHLPPVGSGQGVALGTCTCDNPTYVVNDRPGTGLQHLERAREAGCNLAVPSSAEKNAVAILLALFNNSRYQVAVFDSFGDGMSCGSGGTYQATYDSGSGPQPVLRFSDGCFATAMCDDKDCFNHTTSFGSPTCP